MDIEQRQVLIIRIQKNLFKYTIYALLLKG
jgi:hypothetical protein